MKSRPAPVESTDPMVSALLGSCATADRNLRQALGDHGCDALLSRAVATIEARHPLAADLRQDQVVTRERLAMAVQVHGAAATEAAVESLVATLVDILARLIGEDMAVRLIDPDGDTPMHDAAGAP